jgi:hypothetical protein
MVSIFSLFPPVAPVPVPVRSPSPNSRFKTLRRLPVIIASPPLRIQISNPFPRILRRRPIPLPLPLPPPISNTMTDASAATAMGSGRELANPPSDGISNIRFSNHSDHLLVSSWDKVPPFSSLLIPFFPQAAINPSSLDLTSFRRLRSDPDGSAVRRRGQRAQGRVRAPGARARLLLPRRLLRV